MQASAAVGAEAFVDDPLVTDQLTQALTALGVTAAAADAGGAGGGVVSWVFLGPDLDAQIQLIADTIRSTLAAHALTQYAAVRVWRGAFFGNECLKWSCSWSTPVVAPDAAAAVLAAGDAAQEVNA